MLIHRFRRDGYLPDGRRLYFKGGGGGTYYAGLEKLYEMQEEQGRQLMGLANRSVYPAYEGMVADAKNYGSLANRENAASRAVADTQGAIGNARANLQEQLTSQGVDPTDPRYARTFANMELAGAAQTAAAATGARDRVEQLGYARQKDLTSLGMGVGSDAASALSAAGGSLSAAGNMQAQNAMANAQGSAALATLGTRLMFKAGGMVRKCYADGGKVGAGPMDFSSRYNTKLMPKEEAQFQAWAKSNNRLGDLYDYDMRGAWRDMQRGGAGQSENGHFTDRYKKPNHPTFSDQSQYHGTDGYRGGTWGKDSAGRDTFTPGAVGLWKDADLQRYFKEVEPSAVLVPRKFASGGPVRRLGILGAIGGIKPPAPPASTPSQGTGGALAANAGAATSGAGTAATRLGGRIEKLGETFGSRGMQDFGRGMSGKPGLDVAGGDFSLSTTTTPTAAAGGAGQVGEKAVDYSLASTAPASGAHGTAGIGSVAGEAAGVADTAGSGLLANTVGATGGAAAEAAGSGLAATGAAEGIGAAAAGEAAAAGGASTLGATVGAAMPWVGAAMLAGSALGLFRDGGKVRRNVIRPHSDDRRGGPVQGSGGPKDDKVPAMLSAGEFVMPAGAVALYGEDKLEEMRQRGLQHEKEMGIA